MSLATIKRIVLALALLVPSLAFAQGGQVTLIQSSTEPLPNCTPASQGQLQPQIWDVTAQQMKTCTAPNTWSQMGGGSGGGPGSGTQNAVADWATSSTLGSIYSTLFGQLLQAQNGAAPSWSVQGLPLGNSGVPSTCVSGYTVQADTSTSILDRGTVLIFNSSSACAVTLPDPSTTGMGSSFPVKMSNIGAGTVTVTRASAATFTIVTGSSVIASATSFTLLTGQFITLHSDNTNWWGEEWAGSGTVSSGTAGQPTVYTGPTTVGPSSIAAPVTSPLYNTSGIPWYDVTADPTGATDSTASINATIAGCPAQGCTVHIPRGTYKLATALTSLSINAAHINFICDPGTIIQAQTGFTSGYPELELGSSSSVIVVQYCVFDGNSIAGYGVQALATTNDIYLEHNEFKNHTSEGVEGAIRTGGQFKLSTNYFHNEPIGFYDYAGNGGNPTHLLSDNLFTSITNAIAIGSSGISNSEVEYNRITNVTGSTGTSAALYCFGDDYVQWNNNYFNVTDAAIHADTVGGGSISFNTSIGATVNTDIFAEASSYVTMEGNKSYNSANTAIIVGEGSSASPASLLTQFQSFNSTTGITAGSANCPLTSNSSDHQGNSTASLVVTCNGSFTSGTLFYFNFGSATTQYGGFEEIYVKSTSGNLGSNVLSLVCSANTNLSTPDQVVPLGVNTMLSSTWYHIIQYANGWQGENGGNGGTNNGWKSCGVAVNVSSPSIVLQFDDFETGPVPTGDSILSNKVVGSSGDGIVWGAQSGIVVANNDVENLGGSQGIAYQNNNSTNTLFTNNRSVFNGQYYGSGPNSAGTHLNSDATGSTSTVFTKNDITNAGKTYAQTNSGIIRNVDSNYSLGFSSAVACPVTPQNTNDYYFCVNGANWLELGYASTSGTPLATEDSGHLYDETTAPGSTPAANKDVIYGDSTYHGLKGSTNNSNFHTIPLIESGISACATSTKAITYGTAFTSTPAVLVFDYTTKGGANLSAGPSSTGFTVSCTGATDAFAWEAIGQPN
jgi:hypothetical protein